MKRITISDSKFTAELNCGGKIEGRVGPEWRCPLSVVCHVKTCPIPFFETTRQADPDATSSREAAAVNVVAKIEDAVTYLHENPSDTRVSAA